MAYGQYIQDDGSSGNPAGGPSWSFDPSQASPTTGITGNGGANQVNNQSQQTNSNSSSGPNAWIDQALKDAQSTDDPSYWYKVIANDPKVAAGDPSAINYWKWRISIGDGAAAVRNGTAQTFQDGSSNSGGNTLDSLLGNGGLMALLQMLGLGQNAAPAAPVNTGQNPYNPHANTNTQPAVSSYFKDNPNLNPANPTDGGTRLMGPPISVGGGGTTGGTNTGGMTTGSSTGSSNGTLLGTVGGGTSFLGGTTPANQSYFSGREPTKFYGGTTPVGSTVNPAQRRNPYQGLFGMSAPNSTPGIFTGNPGLPRNNMSPNGF